MSPRVPLVAALIVVLAAPAVHGLHDRGCTPTREPTDAEVQVLNRRFYAVRDFGPHVWLYEEANGVPGLQRGGIGFFGACFPPQPLRCLIQDEDPVISENCGHGPDAIIL